MIIQWITLKSVLKWSSLSWCPDLWAFGTDRYHMISQPKPSCRTIYIYNNGILPHDFHTFSHCYGYKPLRFFCSKHPFRSAFRSPSTSRLKGSGLGDSTTPSSLRHLRYLRVYEAIGHELIWIDLALDR